MSVQELEECVSRLPRSELADFAKWFEEYFAGEWDRQIEEDARSGRLDAVVRKAEEQIEAGQFTPL